MEPPLSPAVVLAAYVEPLLDGRKVVVYGDATSPLAEQLHARGARVVHVYDHDPARAAEASARNLSRNISIAPLGEAGIAVRDGAFDIAIVECLPAKGANDLLRRVQRALANRGVALVASPNPEVRRRLIGHAPDATDVLGYYDLYDTVSEHFEEVRMIGQTPFLGYAIVDFAPDADPDVTVDTGFVPGGGEEPEWFIAVASARPVDLDPFSVIQLPAEPLLRPRPAKPTPDPEVERLRAELKRCAERIAELESNKRELTAEHRRAKPDLQAARDRILQLEAETERLRRREDHAAEAKQLAAKVERLEAELAGGTAPLEELERLEAELASGATRLEKLERQAEEANRKAANAAQRMQTLEKAASRAEQLEQQAEEANRKAANATQRVQTLEEAAARAQELSRTLAAAQESEKQLREQLQAQAKQLGVLTDVASREPADDIAEVESALKARGNYVRELEVALREARRVGAELVEELRSRSAPSDGAPLADKNAQLEADLAAARWTVAELESRLAAQTRSESEREALGDALRQARAELQRQAALIEQIRAKSRQEAPAR